MKHNANKGEIKTQRHSPATLEKRLFFFLSAGGLTGGPAEGAEGGNSGL
jgi:hypothetical protein